MPHSFNKIWIHSIWSTKDRMPLIDLSFENNLYQNISEQPHHNIIINWTGYRRVKV
ncbi:MAG: hypothetical protein KGZ71_07930 [Desulfobulbaceae bacterium]|nr:hypothetical protein [Desulfobulbaceae bacterium]